MTGQKDAVGIDVEALAGVADRFEHNVMRFGIAVVLLLLLLGVFGSDDDVPVPLRLPRLFLRASPPEECVLGGHSCGVQGHDQWISMVRREVGRGMAGRRRILGRQEHRVRNGNGGILPGHLDFAGDSGADTGGKRQWCRQQRNQLPNPLRTDALQAVELFQQLSLAL